MHGDNRTRDYTRADFSSPSLPLCSFVSSPSPQHSAIIMLATAAGSGGAGGNRPPFKPHLLERTPDLQPTTKRKQRRSPVSVVSPAASSNGSDDDGVLPVLQQQINKPRTRLVWTPELHARFVRACRILGSKAVPTKILGVMNVEGVTRENVASHLQKYREKLQPKGGRDSSSSKNKRGGATTKKTRMRRCGIYPAASLQQQPVLLPQQAPSPSPSPSLNDPPPRTTPPPPPPPPPRGSSFAAAAHHMPQHPPQIGHGHGGHAMLHRQALLSAPPTTSVHQQAQDNFTAAMAALPVPQQQQLFFQHQSPQLQAQILRRMAMMRQQQQPPAAAVAPPGHMMNQNHHHHHHHPTGAPGHMNQNRHHPAAVAMNYELGAVASGGMPSQHRRVQPPRIEASRAAVNTTNDGGLFGSVPEAAGKRGDEQTEEAPRIMGLPQMRQTAAVEVGTGPAAVPPAAEPDFTASAEPDDSGQQEEPCDILRFWDTPSEPSMDYYREFPPDKPT